MEKKSSPQEKENVISYKNVLRIQTPTKIIWYGIDHLTFNIENLHTANKEIWRLFKYRFKTLAWKLKRHAWKDIAEIRKHMKEMNIEGTIDAEAIAEKVEKILKAEYISWNVDIDVIYSKIEKAYDIALSKVTNTIIREELRKLFIESNSTIFFLRRMRDATKHATTRYKRDVYETSTMFKVRLYFLEWKQEIDLLSAEIYKSFHSYTGNITFYWMYFRLAAIWKLVDIEPIITQFIILKDSVYLQRLDLYIDYVWWYVLWKKQSSYDDRKVKVLSSFQDDQKIETIYHEFWQNTDKRKNNITARNYKSKYDKYKKWKKEYYKEYEKYDDNEVMRIEMELHFWSKYLNNKFWKEHKIWKILSHIKYWDHDFQTYVEYLFWGLFWYKIQDPEEFWLDHDIVVQYRNLFWFSETTELRSLEIKVQQKWEEYIYNLMNSIRWAAEKLAEQGVDIEDYIQQIREWKKKFEIKRDKTIRDFQITMQKVYDDIQNRASQKDKMYNDIIERMYEFSKQLSTIYQLPSIEIEKKIQEIRKEKEVYTEYLEMPYVSFLNSMENIYMSILENRKKVEQEQDKRIQIIAELVEKIEDTDIQNKLMQLI